MTNRGPRISINKLGEYLVANPSRRRQILRDQKHPPEIKVIRYAAAERAITACIVGGFGDEILERHLRALVAASASPSSKYDADRIRDCTRAIRAFRAMAPLKLSGAIAERGAMLPALSLAGVEISVRPEIVLVREDDKGGTASVGLVKLCLSKTHQMSEEAGAYVAALGYRFAQERLAARGAARPGLVLVADIFQGQVFSTPKALVRRLSNVEAACEEIAGRWSAI